MDRKNQGPPPAANRLIRGLLMLLIAAAALWAGLLDFLPPLEKDALIHHLAIPRLWLKAGGFVQTPWASFSYYPMNLELLYLWPLSWGADWGAKFIHHAFGLMTAALIFVYLRRRLSLEWALLGALLFLSTPAVMRLAASAYVDLGLTFFITAAVLGLVSWHETGRTKFFLLSAAALGLGLGTKYQGLMALPCLSLAAAGIRSRAGDGPSRSIAWAAAYLSLAGLVFSPWLIKNMILTGNPTYPLFNTLWGLPGMVPAEMKFDVFTLREFHYGESFWEVLLVPFRVFFQGQDFSPKHFGSVLSPVLLLLPPLALIRPRTPELRLFGLFALYWILVIFFKSAMVARYLAPILPILAVLSVFGFERLWSFLKGFLPRPAARGLLVLIPAGFLALNAAWAWDFWKMRDPGPYLRGQESRGRYLTRKLGHYPAMEFINRRLPASSRILFLYAGSRGYYCEKEYFFQTWFSGELVRPILEKARSSEEVRRGLKGLGATHVLTREVLLLKWLGETFTREKAGLWIESRNKYMKELFRDRGYGVFRIE